MVWGFWVFLFCFFFKLCLNIQVPLVGCVWPPPQCLQLGLIPGFSYGSLVHESWSLYSATWGSQTAFLLDVKTFSRNFPLPSWPSVNFCSCWHGTGKCHWGMTRGKSVGVALGNLSGEEWYMLDLQRSWFHTSAWNVPGRLGSRTWCSLLLVKSTWQQLKGVMACPCS